jgi:hypothetical protein
MIKRWAISEVATKDSLPHSLPDDWRPDPVDVPPIAPDRYRCRLGDAQAIRVLCGPCKRPNWCVIVCDRHEDCRCAETDAACSGCGIGNEESGNVQLEMDYEKT